MERTNQPLAEIGVRTDPGRDPEKQVNEDAFLHVETPLGLLALVCDGMGGHAGGKEASALAIATIDAVLKEATPRTPRREALRVALEEANRRIFEMPTAEAGYRPGSTVVAALIHEGGADLAHVGDSRIYLVHAGSIAQVTRDHSMVQELVDRKIIAPEAAATHPDANKILRALGIAKATEVEVRAEPLRFVAGDVMVLCSDGLSDLVQPQEILDIASASPPAQAAGRLVDLANARGGHDNITVLVLRFLVSADTRDAATIVKTMQVTAHDGGEPASANATLMAAPLQQAAGGTAVVPAMAPAPASHPNQPPSGPGAHIPAAPPPPRASEHDGHTPRWPLFVGLGLAVIALAALGAGLVLQRRPRRHQVPVVEHVRDASVPTAAPPDAPPPDEIPDEPIEPAPPLAPAVPSLAPSPAPTPTPAPTLPRGAPNTR